MFKIGDKVVCIDNKFNNIIDADLELYKIYTIRKLYPTFKPNVTFLEYSNVMHDIKRFISIKEYRKLKLEKLNLCSK